MDPPFQTQLSRRERQIMEAMYRLGEASVAAVQEELSDSPDYHAVRVAMAKLEEKGYLKHRQQGRRYIYMPEIPRDEAKRSALGHLVHTYFSGAPSEALLTLLNMSADALSDDDIAELEAWITQAKDLSDDD
jgi:predicted transcriptional regulator